MMHYLYQARSLLKRVIPWSEEELRKGLDADYKKLEEEKKNLLFTLDKVEEELYLTLDKHEHKEQFVKAKVIINKAFICHVDMYFYFKDEDRWEKSVISFSTKIVLDMEDRMKLENAPPLEIDFML